MGKRKSFGKNVYVRMWQERFLMLWKVLLVLAVVVPLGFGGYVLYQRVYISDMFLLKEIKVKGQKRLTQNDIYQSLQVSRGQHIFDVDITQMSQRLLRHPYVKDVQIRRILPYTLDIRVVERTPYILLLYQRHYYEIDREGYIVRVRNKKEDSSKPVVTGLRYLKEKLIVGSPVTSPKILKALEVMKTFSVSEVARALKIKKINMGNIKQIILTTTDDVKIQLGSNEFQQKLESLSVIMQEKKTSMDNASYVDLRFGGVIIRPKRKWRDAKF